jgi:phosphate transport system substrate-binding protein
MLLLECATWRDAIGYAGVGCKAPGVRLVPIEGVDATGAYPLARPLRIYINKVPAKPLDPIVKEFFRFVYSKEGQDVVVKDGNVPLSAKQAAEELKKLE